MVDQGNYLHVEVEAEEYSELADELERWGRAVYLRYVNEYDRDPDEQDGFYEVTVDSWASGPRLYIATDHREHVSVDSRWTDIVFHAGYTPHGVIQDDDEFMWYLRSKVDAFERMKQSADAKQGQIDDWLDEYTETSFEDYLYDEVGIENINDVEQQRTTNTYHIEHGWFNGDELANLAGDDGVNVVGVDADQGYIVVDDVRED